MIIFNRENCKENIYTGETGRTLKHRLVDNRGYVVNKMTKIAHFITPGHTLDNLKITILEDVKVKDSEYRKEIE